MEALGPQPQKPDVSSLLLYEAQYVCVLRGH